MPAATTIAVVDDEQTIREAMEGLSLPFQYQDTHFTFGRAVPEIEAAGKRQLHRHGFAHARSFGHEAEKRTEPALAASADDFHHIFRRRAHAQCRSVDGAFALLCKAVAVDNLIRCLESVFTRLA